MTTLETLKWDGKKSGKVTLDLAVAKETSSADLIHRAVLRQLANKRQGTASTLTRSEVRGGGRKPYKQKGTGRARQGSIRTPLRPGGGIIFGPKPRSYNLDMNRKERRLALRTALMSRVSDMKAVEDFGSTLKEPKTSDIIKGLDRLGVQKTEKVLVILDSPSDVIKKSINNIEKVKLISADQLNVFEHLPRNELYDETKEIPVGLISLDKEITVEGFPGKTFDYLSMNKILLCFANSDSAVSKFIEKYELGFTIDPYDETSMKKIFDKLNDQSLLLKYQKNINNLNKNILNKSKVVEDYYSLI